MESSELNELVKGILYLPKNHKLNFPEISGSLEFKVLLYDPALVDDGNLNYKFLLPAIETSKNEATDFIVGFDAELKRVILAYKNPEDKFQAFNAHQQAALLTEFFLTESIPEESSAPVEKLVIKSLLLSNQIDNVVKKNEGKIKYTHVGYDSLKEALQNEDEDVVICFDDRNTVLLHSDTTKNALALLDMVSRMMVRLKSQELSLFDKHVAIQTRYNLYGEKTFNIASGSKKMFDKYRSNPPADIIHEELILITDYKKRVFANLLTGRKGTTDLDQMNLVQLDYSSGLRISVEFSEDENKIVLHLSNYTHCYDKSRFTESRKAVHDRLLKTVVALGKM
ncbi:MAG: hypothetical protein WD426_16395 [Anditalea sp.]